MTKLRVVPSLLSAMMFLLVVGCGSEPTPTPGAGAGAEGVQSVTITAKDNVFEPASYTVEAGQPIKLTVVNAGQNIHEVEVKDLLPETKLAPGQSKTVDVASQQPGTHKIYCEIHEDTGMEGEFVIK